MEHDRLVEKSKALNKIINGNMTSIKSCSQEFINTNSDISNETGKGTLNVAMKAPISQRLAGFNDDMNRNLIVMRNNLTVLMNGIKNDINNITKLVTLNKNDKGNTNAFSTEDTGYSQHIQDGLKDKISLRSEDPFRAFDWPDRQKERNMD